MDKSVILLWLQSFIIMQTSNNKETLIAVSKICSHTETRVFMVIKQNALWMCFGNKHKTDMSKFISAYVQQM